MHAYCRRIRKTEPLTTATPTAVEVSTSSFIPRCCSSIPASWFCPASLLGQLVGRPQLSAIIRDLSLDCRAAKIAGCRLRGQEIAAERRRQRLAQCHCSLVARRCVKTLLTSAPMTTCVTSPVETCPRTACLTFQQLSTLYVCAPWRVTHGDCWSLNYTCFYILSQISYSYPRTLLFNVDRRLSSAVKYCEVFLECVPSWSCVPILVSATSSTTENAFYSY